jgi:hypothetical protein
MTRPVEQWPEDEPRRFAKGCFYGVVCSLPFWALVAVAIIRAVWPL